MLPLTQIHSHTAGSASCNGILFIPQAELNRPKLHEAMPPSEKSYFTTDLHSKWNLRAQYSAKNGTLTAQNTRIIALNIQPDQPLLTMVHCFVYKL